MNADDDNLSVASDATPIIDLDDDVAEEEDPQYNIPDTDKTRTITICILGHGGEYYERFLPNYYSDSVKILSVASMPFVVGVGVNIEQNMCNVPMNRKILNRSIELYEKYPNKNEIYIFDKLAEELKMPYINALETEPGVYRKISKERLDLIKRVKRDKNAFSIQIPRHEKTYQIRNDYNPYNEGIIFGVFIVNIKNYDELGLNPSDNLAESGNSFPKLERHIRELNNRELSEVYRSLHKSGTRINLSEIIRLFKGIGFEKINIIDFTCRISYDNTKFSERGKRRIERAEQGLYKSLKNPKKRYTNSSKGGKKAKRNSRKTRKHR